jgi:chemotaxis protein MotB
MFNRVIKRVANKEEEVNYWPSYSDLMAGILIVFMLLFIYIFAGYQTDKQRREIEHATAQQELKKKDQELERTKKELGETRQRVIELSSTKEKIIDLLREEFEKENLKVEIDDDTGAIKLKDSILFDTGKSIIKEEGKKFLQKFIPVYVRILLGNSEVQQQLAEIIVEGHTDDVGSYLYNLDLSQDRAFNVVKYLLGEEFDYEYKEELKKYITANGRSFSKLIYDEDQNVDRDKSRRVEFQFRLKEEEILMEIKKRLEEVE